VELHRAGLRFAQGQSGTGLRVEVVFDAVAGTTQAPRR